MTAETELADEITAFLAKHAKIAADYDPDFDEPGDRFNGPDSGLMERAAEQLYQGLPVSVPRSSWGSGCYAPMSDIAGQAWHDELKRKISDLVPSTRPGP